jgi:hypothetical protein
VERKASRGASLIILIAFVPKPFERAEITKRPSDYSRATETFSQAAARVSLSRLSQSIALKKLLVSLRASFLTPSLSL